MFSLIFQGFSGRGWASAEAFQAAFGERGCFMSLASDSKTYAPCELIANLTEEDARSKAAILQEGGIQIEIVPTADVTDVKHRAPECWPTHRASNGVNFTEWGHIVVRGVSLGLREREREWLTGHPSASYWAFEIGYNHEHPTNTLDRHGLRMTRERGAELGAALTECFPERKFLVSYRDEQVSFCQFTEELPRGISSENRRPVDQRDTCFCEICERRTPYAIRSQPDTEFPHAQFADCTVCDNEVILWADWEVVLASDAAQKTVPVPNVPIDTWERTPSDPNVPSSFAALKAAVQDRLHPSDPWRRAAIRLWLGREPETLSRDQPLIARMLLQVEELSALLMAYRIHQLSLPPESQDRSTLTPERLGIPRRSPLYHPARRMLAPITVVTSIEGKGTSHALLNGTDEYYSAGRRLDPDRPIYESRFEYGVLDTNATREIKRQAFWHTGRDGKQYPVTNDRAPHGAKPWTCQPYEIGKSLEKIQEWGTERCIAYTVLYDEHRRVIAQHRRLFRRFHELDLNPNPTITLNLGDGILTFSSDVFVWGVFLGWRNTSLSPDNAFDLLPGIPYSIPWDETVSGTPSIRLTGNSLFLPSPTVS